MGVANDEDLPVTAYLTALARAQPQLETGVPFDEYAPRFAERCPARILRVMRKSAGLDVILERTRIVDAHLRMLLEGQPLHVVALGAGFDARSHRLSWPVGSSMLELDNASVVYVKNELLPVESAKVRLIRAVCDVSDLAALSDILVKPAQGRRVVVLCEGLLAYFRPNIVRELSRTLATFGSGTEMIADLMSTASARALSAVCSAEGIHLELFGLEDLSPLEEAGWKCTAYRPLSTARSTHRGLSGSAGRSQSTRVVDGVAGFVLG